jgi:hypothetical protein
VIEAVVADEMAVRRDPSSELRMGLDPASLLEPGRDDLAGREGIEDPLRDTGPVRTIGMLRVKGERDPE